MSEIDSQFAFDPQFAEDCLSAIWGAQQLAERIGGSNVIDYNVGPRVSAEYFEDTDHAVSTFRNLQERVPDEPHRDYQIRRLGGMVTFLAKKVEKIEDNESLNFTDEQEFRKYIESTTGAPPELFPEPKLAERAKKLNTMLSMFGLSYDVESAPFYRDWLGIKDIDEVKRRLDRAFKEFPQRAGRYIEVPDQLPKPEIVNQDEPWVGAFFTDENDLPKILANVSLRHLFTHGQAMTHGYHEASHATQAANFKKAIERGELSPAFGVMLLFTLDALQAETLAQNSEHINSDKSWPGTFHPLYNEHLEMVYHNMRIKLHTGTDEAAVLAYGIEHLPFESPDHLKSNLEDWKNPALLAYFLCYGPALELGRPIRDMDDIQRAKVLQPLYNHPHTPEEIKELVATAHK